MSEGNIWTKYGIIASEKNLTSRIMLVNVHVEFTIGWTCS